MWGLLPLAFWFDDWDATPQYDGGPTTSVATSASNSVPEISLAASSSVSDGRATSAAIDPPQVTLASVADPLRTLAVPDPAASSAAIDERRTAPESTARMQASVDPAPVTLVTDLRVTSHTP